MILKNYIKKTKSLKRFKEFCLVWIAQLQKEIENILALGCPDFSQKGNRHFPATDARGVKTPKQYLMVRESLKIIVVL